SRGSGSDRTPTVFVSAFRRAARRRSWTNPGRTSRSRTWPPSPWTRRRWTTMSDFRAALQSRLGRPATDAEVSRAFAMGPAAARLIVATTGPVPRSSHPDQAIAAVAVNMAARVIETGGVLEFTTE